MRAWFLLLTGAVVYVVALLWAAGELPPAGVPMHIDAFGNPTWLGSRALFLTVAAIVGAVALAVGAGITALAVRGPLSLVNVPHREFWTHPDRVGRLRRMLAEDMGATFGAALVFLSFIPASAVLATRAVPPRLPAGLVWIVVGVVLVVVVLWCVWLSAYRYRPPHHA